VSGDKRFTFEDCDLGRHDSCGHRLQGASGSDGHPPAGACQTLCVALLLLVLVWGLGSADGETGPAYRLIWKGSGLPSQLAYAVGELEGNGEKYLVLSDRQLLRIYGWSEEEGRFQLQATHNPVYAPITTLAAADIDRDPGDELLVGTGHAGVVHVFKWADGELRSLGETDYLWAPVEKVQVADLDGESGGHLLVAVNTAGTPYAFRWDGFRFSAIPIEGQQDLRVSHVAVGDLLGDGRDEVVFAEESKLMLFAWDAETEQLRLRWINYPWGSVELIAAIQTEPAQQGEDLLVVTSRHIMYVFGLTEQGVGMRYNLPQAGPLVETVGTWLDAEGYPVFFSSGRSGSAVSTLSQKKLQTHWSAPFLPDVRYVTPLSGNLLLTVWDGTLALWERVAVDEATVVVGDRTYRLTHPPRSWGSSAMLCLRDMADLLGLKIGWDKNSRTVTMVREDVYAAITIGASDARVGQETVPLEVPAVVIDGYTYVPAEFLARVLGTVIVWNPARRTLYIHGETME